MKRTIAGGIALAGALVVSAGCTPEPTSGVVEELEYEPDSYYTSYSCITRYNSKGQYAGQTCTPYNTYVPECFDVDYYDEATDTEGDDCVSEALFNALEIGDTYTKGMTADDMG